MTQADEAPMPGPFDRVRVVTLIDHLGSHGGAEGVALNIATRLDRERFASTFSVSRWPPVISDPSVDHAVEELESAGAQLFPVGRRGTFDVWVWWRLVRFLRRERIDVLHAHKFGSNVWGTLTGRLAGVPVIVAHEHSWSYVGQPLRRFLDRWLISRGAERLIAVSNADRRRMIEIERIAPERTLVIPNGVPAPPSPSGGDARASLGIAPDAPVVVTVGLLRPEKAYDVLVRAAAALAPRYPGLVVLVAGEGGERAPLEALARDLGVPATVRLLGHRTDVPAVLRAADIAVCCSLREGSPLSVMEYMEAGLPVVGSAVGGIPDLIEPGEHGLLVPPGDPDALAAAIGELLDDPERGRAMGARGQARRRAEFDVDAVVRRIERLYLELLAAPAAARRRRRRARG